MAKPCTLHPIPQAEQFFKIETANVAGVEGDSPRVLLGFQRGHSVLRKRMAPLIRTPARRRDTPAAPVRQTVNFFTIS